MASGGLDALGLEVFTVGSGMVESASTRRLAVCRLRRALIHLKPAIVAVVKASVSKRNY